MQKLGWLIILLLLGEVAGAKLFGQCTGNLGENIFTDGDFGRGTANIPQQDPMLAPGFIYVRNPPPNDGFYTITNSTSAWGNNNFGGSWLGFEDNSNDPLGYMMVVNASIQPGIFYEQEVTGLCENTTYQFSADTRNMLFSGGILPQVSFIITNVDGSNEQVLGAATVPTNNRWNTNAFTFETEPGQTSLKLILRNSAPGGLGNDLALDNIEFRACGPEAQVSAPFGEDVCEGGPPISLAAEVIGDQFGVNPAVQWQQSFDEGVTWTNLEGANEMTYTAEEQPAGAYYYRYLLAATEANLTNSKCQVISDVGVANVIPQLTELVDTICAGLTVRVGSNDYGASGTTTDTLVSSLGCDSFVILQLTVLPDPGLMAEFMVEDISCVDATDGSIRLLGVQNSIYPPVQFRLDSVLQVTDSIGSLAAGRYVYEVRDRYGCREVDTLVVDTPEPFVLDLGPDQTITLGEEARVTPFANYPVSAYQFSPEGLINCTVGCEVLSFVPTQTLHLRAVAQNPQGCVATDSVLIAVVPNRDVFLPSAFSPNGDGVNDVFTVFSEANRVLGVARMEVYDRWGSQVFAGSGLPINDLSVGWDGEDAPAGVYVYVVEVTFIDGFTQRFSGSVSLLP